MDRSKLVAEVTTIHLARCALLISKGDDYAGEDVLANFKRMSQLCNLLRVDPAGSATDAALFLALLKLDRWTNLRSKGTMPKNEAIKDTIYDLHNYIDLAYTSSIDEGGDRSRQT